MGIKTLYLLRHAKAEEGRPFMPDKERALSEKGVKDAEKLASRLSKKDLSLDLVLVSPSVRTITTGQIIAAGLHISSAHLLAKDSLYAAETMELLKIISSVSKKINRLMIVGHNPGLMNLASFITGEPLSMATCSLIKFSFDFKDWHEILTTRASKYSLLN